MRVHFFISSGRNMLDVDPYTKGSEKLCYWLFDLCSRGGKIEKRIETVFWKSQLVVYNQTKWEFGIEKHSEAVGNEMPSSSHIETTLSSTEVKNFVE